MSRRLGHPLAVARSAWLLLALIAPPAVAQQVKGPTTCFKCHKPLPRTVWEQTAAFHKDSLKQLSAPKAAGFAAAIGLANPMTDTGRPGDCVSCHATVVGGSVSTGVSCESCHGAASGYFNPHQEPEFYDQPVSKWLGLRNLYNDPKAIAEVCVNCHVTPDPRLKKAGHPAGEGFDPGKGLTKMIHWPTDISAKRKRASYGPALYAQVTAQAAPLASRRLASAGTAVAAVKAGAAVTAGAPAAPAPRGAVGARAADPFDWDQPVAELPASYPGDAGGAPAPGAALAAPATAPAIARAPSTAAEAPPAPAPPPLIAPSSGVTPTPTPGVALPPKAPLPALRGRAVVLITDLLKSKGAGQLVLPKPAPPQEFAGPDGELLRLQDEALYLALETLRKSP